MVKKEEGKNQKQSEDTTPTRDRLLKLLGDSVKLIYMHDEIKCGIIGWLFRVNMENIRLKMTSTRNESYSTEDIAIDKIVSVSIYDWD